jgi:hypothetical protein
MPCRCADNFPDFFDLGKSGWLDEFTDHISYLLHFFFPMNQDIPTIVVS